MRIAGLIFLFFCFISCRSDYDHLPADISNIVKNSPNQTEIIKAIDHYKTDTLKRKALFFLIRNMDDRFAFAGNRIEREKRGFVALDFAAQKGPRSRIKCWDSILKASAAIVDTSTDKKSYDINVMSSKFLVGNIDTAFLAWRFPWSASLSFQDFCRYILPYKLKNESISNWRSFFFKKYKWIADSLKNKQDAKQATILIIHDVNKWFTINSGFKHRYNMNINDILHSRVGTCEDATQLVAYACRAIGIPVTLDFTPYWANKGGNHAWNCLILKNNQIVFTATETTPGTEKIEFSLNYSTGVPSMRRKRAKIFRYSFEKNNTALNADTTQKVDFFFSDKHIVDVTKTFIPVSDILIQVPLQFQQSAPFVFLCVFNNQNWHPIAGEKNIDHNILFKNMGRNVIYLPIVYQNEKRVPIGFPILIAANGTIKTLMPNQNQLTKILIMRKYPEDESNKIIIGKLYELFYMDRTGWRSLGKQKAAADSLAYNKVPSNSLLYLRCLTDGFQERVFTMENSKQVWW